MRTFYRIGALHKGGRDRANADLRVTGKVSILFLSAINYIQTFDTFLVFYMAMYIKYVSRVREHS